MKIKAVKKPVVIEAIQWTGENFDEIKEFCGCIAIKSSTLVPVTYWRYNGFNKDCLMIRTLEGDHKATIEDYIIKGVHGECYPCKKRYI